jgi:hypothetical protein
VSSVLAKNLVEYGRAVPEAVLRVLVVPLDAGKHHHDRVEQVQVSLKIVKAKNILTEGIGRDAFLIITS